MNIQLLEGKTAIVTGASEGIGYSISELFAREGATVYMIARRQEKLDAAVAQAREAAGTDKIYGIAGSVSDKDLCKQICKRVYEEQGAIDILVNNAGISNTYGIDSTTDEEWEAVMETNVNALFRWCREAAGYMEQNHSGNILNISSCCGFKPLSGCAYSSSKGAVNALTKNMAYRYVDSGIRVNALLPGRVMTPMQSKNRAREAQDAGKNKTNMHTWGDKYINRDLPPLGPDGQAYPALFLASDILSHDVTGVCLPVDGGSYML